MAIEFKRNRTPRRSSTGSMADIAFLLLIFFLVATTIFDEKGVKSTLPEWKPNARTTATHVDNVIKVFVNGKNQVLFQDKAIPKNNFEKTISDNLTLLMKKDDEVELTVSLGYDRSTNYGLYFSILSGIKNAFKNAYDEYAMSKFKHKFDECSKTEKEQIFSALIFSVWEMPVTDYLAKGK